MITFIYHSLQKYSIKNYERFLYFLSCSPLYETLSSPLNSQSYLSSMKMKTPIISARLHGAQLLKRDRMTHKPEPSFKFFNVKLILKFKNIRKNENMSRCK